MSKLRILEEERRKPRTMPMEERERILEAMQGILEEERYVELAVVYGGFLHSKVFRDVDVAVMLRGWEAGEDLLAYVEELRDKLEEAVGIGVDIQLLNDAPPAFTYHVLCEGRVIVERSPGIAAVVRMHALEDMRRLRKHLSNH